MLRFLYTTDLHGDTRAYARLPALCREHGIGIIVNGGDMLPKGRSMHAEQAAFLKDSFPRFLDRCAQAGIVFYGLFGNDDLRAFHDDWLELTRTRSGVHDLTERWYPLPAGYLMRGNSLVPDYPFGLKDWCVRDTQDAQPVPTRGRPVTSTREGMEVIEDPAAFFAARPTLEEHLDSLIDPAVPMDKVILVTHPPPAGLWLGSLWSGEDVGSKSVRSWIDRHQPRLTLSGHIHESPDVGLAEWGEPSHTAKCGRTLCHQPGQDLPDRLTYSIIEVPEDVNGAIRVVWERGSLRSTPD